MGDHLGSLRPWRLISSSQRGRNSFARPAKPPATGASKGVRIHVVLYLLHPQPELGRRLKEFVGSKISVQVLRDWAAAPRVSMDNACVLEYTRLVSERLPRCRKRFETDATRCIPQWSLVRVRGPDVN